ncbi:ABC transporter permease [Deinococcus roseus]|uniref:Autoinducer 2 import system permease protein LsrC n=1 Tax=Deinococcus roseus TaxID=392414 RepID=A0ABQ2D1Y2_9DEIO|nr:ABC transporter permease [Deinococcus roseus]GGJ42521.1 branched-chain amino acid ABC transporter permease [Deinococcus roseus]
MKLLKTHRQEAVLLLILVLGFVLVGLITPSFFSIKTLDTLWHDSALLLTLALAQMLIIMSRGIDLSVASNLALSGMLVALLSQHFPGLPMPVLLLVGAVSGSLLGMVNSFLITGLNLPPIVATLGTMSVFRGLIYVVSEGKWITSKDLPQHVMDFPNARFLGLSTLQWEFLVVLGLFFVVVHHSRFGREIRAYGGNPSASKYVGIPEKPRVFALYVLSGLVSGIVGVLWVARYAIAYTEVAQGFELQVIAACVLGGVSIAGGVGTVIGTMLGSLFLVGLYNALPVVHVSPFWQTALVGLSILVAVVVNQGARKAIGKNILRQTGQNQQAGQV